jgi:hypothetical protein
MMNMIRQRQWAIGAGAVVAGTAGDVASAVFLGSDAIAWWGLFYLWSFMMALAVRGIPRLAGWLLMFGLIPLLPLTFSVGASLDARLTFYSLPFLTATSIYGLAAFSAISGPSARPELGDYARP